MEYKEIVSVTGESGLFQLVSSKSDGAIVRSLDGKTTRFVPSRNHNFTPLESIEIFTTGENVPLSEVFKMMQEKEESTPVIEPSDDSAIKQYFAKVYPDLDKERVYMSDMKKMLKWYPVLKANDLLHFEDEAEEEEDTEKASEKKDKAPVESKEAKENKETKTEKKTTKKSPAKEEQTGKKAQEKKTAEKKASPNVTKKPAAAKKKTTATKKSTGKSK